MSLETAIEAVYDAFSDVEKPRGVDGCPCCMTADEYATLTTKPLRELSAPELGEYASDAMLTMGSEDDYQYFLPRILKLTIEDDTAWITSIEITAQKINLAGFDKWSEAKVDSIKNLWLAVIHWLATSESDPELLGYRTVDIESWVRAATLIPIAVSPLTDVLEGVPDVVRILYNQNFKTIFQGKLDNAFLSEPSQGQTEIANWLRLRIEQAMNN